MAHKYDSFVDAYADMCDAYEMAAYYYSEGYNMIDAACDEMPSPPDAYHCVLIGWGAMYIGQGINRVIKLLEGAYDQSHLYESIYWGAQSGGGLDWDSLLNLMLIAEPDQYEMFIGLVDAYRMALWNRPFNIEFYAALARGFAQWV